MLRAGRRSWKASSEAVWASEWVAEESAPKPEESQEASEMATVAGKEKKYRRRR